MSHKPRRIALALALWYSSWAPVRLAAQDPIDDLEITGLGDTTCVWGSRDCNRCVVDVPGQVGGLRRFPVGRFTYLSGAGLLLDGMEAPLLPLTLHGENKEKNKGHVQGFNRLPGLGGAPWLVASVSTKKKTRPGRPAGLLLSRLADIPANGGLPLVPAGGDRDVFWLPLQAPGGPKPPIQRRGRVFHAIAATKHPGGFQTIGRIVVVANYCNGPRKGECSVPTPPPPGGLPTAFVDFIAVEPSAGGPDLVETERIGRLLLGDIGADPHKMRAKAFYAAITRMDNGHYLLMVNRSDQEHMQFFLSTTTFLGATTEWRSRGTRDFRSKTYQNMSFVTECVTGRLFLLGYQQKGGWDAENRIDLFRVVPKGRNIDIEKILDTFLAESNDTCETRGGSGVYVTPGGQLVVSCSQGRSGQRLNQDPLLLNFSEFTAAPSPVCGDGQRQPPEECDDGNTFEGVCLLDGAPCSRIGHPCPGGDQCVFDGCSSFCGTTCDTGFACRTDADCPDGNLVCDEGCCAFVVP